MVSSFFKRLYELHPVARGLSLEDHCRLLMGEVLPRETENTTVDRYLIAISKLRLGILTEQGEGACSFFRSAFICLSCSTPSLVLVLLVLLLVA